MSRESPTARRERILGYLREHPDSTAREIGEAVLHPSVRAITVAGVLKWAESLGLCHRTGIARTGANCWRVGRRS